MLDLSLDGGLSGSGRLHDLFVTLDAVSPGEAKSGGRGLTLRYGVHPTPFGEALIAVSPHGICTLRFLAVGDDAESLLRADWPHAALRVDDAATAPLIATIFGAARPAVPLALWLKGSNFQFRVWRALLPIQPGGLATYRRLAEGIRHPRAVGNAVAANPLAYLIPCHRVIRESGTSGSNRWGPVRKTAIQGWESGAEG